MSGIVDTKAQKYTRRDGSLILIFGEPSGVGSHQQFNFHGSDEVADRIVLAWNSYASSQAEIERLREVLSKFMDYADAEYVPNTLFDRARAALSGSKE